MGRLVLPQWHKHNKDINEIWTMGFYIHKQAKHLAKWHRGAHFLLIDFS